MLKRLSRWQKVALIAVAIALVALALFLVSFSFPAAYEICGPNEYTHEKECSKHYGGPFVALWVVGVADAHNGLITAIATIWLGWITYGLVSLGKKQSVTSRAELRAYVLAVDPTIDKWNTFEMWSFLAKRKSGETTGDPPQFSAQLQLKNFGKTPASEVQIFGGMRIMDYDVKGETPISALHFLDLIYTDLGVGTAVFGPGYGRSKSEPLHDENNSPREGRPPRLDEIAGLNANKKAIFLYGEIRYWDEFGNARWTTYCFICNREIHQRRNGGMAAFKAWNDAGEQNNATDASRKATIPFCKRSPPIERGGVTEKSARLAERRAGLSEPG